MVKLIVGNRGTGKTKALLDLVNQAVKSTKGNIVCIEKGDALKFDLSHKIRLINIEDYALCGPDAYYGFIAGLLAGNYDITEIFGDATFRILYGKDKKDYEGLADFVERLSKLTAATNAVITFTVSCGPNDLPARIQDNIIH